ncbi:MAG: nicotinate-nucleotide adenylyltransferase [Lachnospiraceae bacterium]|jgi:nicotinate-nucleotide adenylyltransferase|nr:nicotinate-nucleotide adenylyltransferase [Lachnospiraceae bacterium]
MGKIGIIGGAFDPIHNGHIHIAVAANKHLGLDEILFVPANDFYEKEGGGLTEARHRREMVNLAVGSMPGVVVSDIELSVPKKTYTFETIEKLKEFYSTSELYFIVGADTIYSMETWKEPEYVFRNVVTIVAKRDDYSDEDVGKHIAYLAGKYNTDIRFLMGEKINVSSQAIRKRVRMGESIYGLVPDEVEEYILFNGLYEK